MTFFIYSRKSIDTGKGESVENQIEMCRQYIKAKFPDTKDEDVVVYEDEGFSAKNTHRPQFQKMLRELKSNKPDFLVCYRLDRISRNVGDFASLIEELNRREISFLCIREEFDTSKPMGKAMMYIASVFAQLERETIAQRVRDNMLMLARNGRWLGGTPPTGYQSERIQEVIWDGKRKVSYKLKEIPDELQTVLLIFQKFLELKSLSGVSKYFIRQGIASRNGRQLSPIGIKSLLQNPVYCTADKDARRYFTEQGADVCFLEQECSDTYGLFVYNKRDYRKKNAPRQSISQWVVAIGKHKGLICGKDWIEAQQILSGNASTGKRDFNSHNNYALLSGLLSCGICGRRMFAKKRSGKGKEGLFDYLCSGKLQGGMSVCHCQNIGGLDTDKAVWSHLLPYFAGSQSVFPMLDALLSVFRRKADLKTTKKGGNRTKQIQAEIDTLLHIVSSENLDEAFIQQVSNRIASLDQKLKATLQKRQIAAAENEDFLSLASKLSRWHSVFWKAPIRSKQLFLRQILCKIEWKEGELHIYIAGP